MTNGEKFKEIFGFECDFACPSTTSLCDNFIDCDICPFNDFFDKEYDKNFMDKIKESIDMHNTKEDKVNYPGLNELPDCDYDCEHCIHNNDEDDFFEDDEDDEICLITAEGARTVSNHYIKNTLEKEISMLNREIVDACKIGKNSVCIDGSVSADAKELLIKNGFKVTTGSQYNESFFTIKWGV